MKRVESVPVCEGDEASNTGDAESKMESGLGSFVKELRGTRQLSLGDLARSAGVHKATLSRWEAGQRLPRLPELEAVLTALGATGAQQRKAIGLLDAPRGVREVRARMQQGASVFMEIMERAPCGGDLLRAMRLRQRKGLAEVAGAIGVQASTLSRWERGEVWPATESLHALCHALGAREAEIVALTTGMFRKGYAQADRNLSSEALEDRLHRIMFGDLNLKVEELKDLLLFDLEAQIWPLAARQPPARQLLIRLYSLRANDLSSQRRWSEIPAYADRAMELAAVERVELKYFFHAVMAAAQTAVYRGQRPAPTRGIQVVRPWIGTPARPAFQAWAHSNLASYMSLAGRADESIQLAQEACTITEQDSNLSEGMLRRMDLARMYLNAGAPASALAALPTRIPWNNRNLARLLLLRAEASRALDDNAVAHASLQQVYTLLDQDPLEPLRRQADDLAAQL